MKNSKFTFSELAEKNPSVEVWNRCANSVFEDKKIRRVLGDDCMTESLSYLDIFYRDPVTAIELICTIQPPQFYDFQRDIEKILPALEFTKKWYSDSVSMNLTAYGKAYYLQLATTDQTRDDIDMKIELAMIKYFGRD